MKKLKILWISDDQKDMEETYNSLYNDRGLYFDIIEEWKYIKGYDLVFVDYGFIGCWSECKTPEHKRIRILQDYYNEGCVLAWLGGLGGTGNYSSDVIEQFPKNKFLHSIPDVSLHRFSIFAFNMLENKND